MFKKALQMKLRISSKYGELSVERLFDLNLADLKIILIDLDKKVKESTENSLDFLETESDKETDDKIRFEIVKDIYLTKVSEKKSAIEDRETRKADEAILEIIARKKREDLENMSIEELEAKLSKNNKS